MTSTPQSPECAAKTTFSSPTASSVCQRSRPNRMRRDLAGRQVDGGHDHAVEEQAQVDRAEAAHGAGRLARVAQLVELEVGQHAGAPPQARVEEDRRDAGERERPPLPVARRRPACARSWSPGWACRSRTWWRPSRARASHHGTERPEAKNSAVLLPDRFPKNSAGTKQMATDSERDDPVEGLELHGPNVYSFGGAGTRPAAFARGVSGRLWRARAARTPSSTALPQERRRQQALRQQEVVVALAVEARAERQLRLGASSISALVAVEVRRRLAGRAERVALDLLARHRLGQHDLVHQERARASSGCDRAQLQLRDRGTRAPRAAGGAAARRAGRRAACTASSPPPCRAPSPRR